MADRIDDVDSVAIQREGWTPVDHRSARGSGRRYLPVLQPRLVAPKRSSGAKDPGAPEKVTPISPATDPALPLGVAPASDLGNAHRLRAKHGNDLRHTGALGWLVNDGARYEPDTTGAAARRIHDVTKDMLIVAAKMKLAAVSKSDSKLEAAADAALAWAKKSQGEPRINAALGVAATLEGIAVHVDAFDRDPLILNCPNGVLDLTEQKLRPHDRADMLTKVSSVKYDERAEAPTWLRFLGEIFKERQELIDFVQRAVGYSLTGLTTEQCFFVLYGEGSNGKSTLLETLRFVLGDGYAMTTSTDTFLRTKERGTENDVARLRGARLVTAVESGEGRKLDEQRIKRLTGTDTVSARFLYKEHFEFMPTCKIWLAVNAKPEITGVDHGIWRRVRLIPFDVKFTDPDQELPTKLQAEAAGILRWAVDGCAAWFDIGLAAPEEVLAATKGWKDDANVVARFVSDECKTDVPASWRTKTSALYSAFEKWCAAEGEEHMSPKKFGQRLETLGFKADREGAARLRTGIALLEPETDDNRTGGDDA